MTTLCAASFASRGEQSQSLLSKHRQDTARMSEEELISGYQYGGRTKLHGVIFQKSQGLIFNSFMVCVLHQTQNHNLACFSHGFETWSITLREEQMFFENRLLRRIFGTKQKGMEKTT